MAQFKLGVSGNPAGRPRGIQDRRAKLRGQVSERLPEVVEVVVNAALAGDMAACKLLLDKAIPNLRPMDQTVQLGDGETEIDGEAIVHAMAVGRLTPDQASRAASVVLAALQMREITELEARLSKLEANHDQ